MKNKNMSIWNAVEKTDISHTKKVNQRGGYTAIDPQYQLQEATKQFGPYGKGFGLCKTDFDMSLFESLGTVIHKAVFFYIMDGDRVEFPITNAIQATTGLGEKKRVDVDFAKKVETNTVSKALSKLGFNADVFMGLFEDNQYLHELHNEQQLKKADDKDAEIAKQRQEYEEWKQSELAAYPSLKTMNALQTVFTSHIRKCKRHTDEDGIRAFTAAKDKQKAIIEKEQGNEAV